MQFGLSMSSAIPKLLIDIPIGFSSAPGTAAARIEVRVAKPERERTKYWNFMVGKVWFGRKFKNCYSVA